MIICIHENFMDNDVYYYSDIQDMYAHFNSLGFRLKDFRIFFAERIEPLFLDYLEDKRYG